MGLRGASKKVNSHLDEVGVDSLPRFIPPPQGIDNPVRFPLTLGQISSAPQARPLFENFEFECQIGDKAYDDQALIDEVVERGIEIVIPARRNRRQLRQNDREMYKERHLIKC